MREFQIDDYFLQFIPPLSDQEKIDLESSILKEGCRDPLTIWDEENVLIDGHNRLRVCEGHEVPYQIQRLSFDSRDEVLQWMVTNQFARRNLSVPDRCDLGLKLLEIERQLADKRRLSGERNEDRKADRRAGEAVRRSAQQVGVGRNTLQRWIFVKNNASSETIERIRLGEESIFSVDKRIRQTRKKEEYAQSVRERRQRAENANVSVRYGEYDVFPGQWWKLGPHWLYCGDSSDPEFVDSLPACQFAFGDPPYVIGNMHFDAGFEWKHDYMVDKAKFVAISAGNAQMGHFIQNSDMPFVWTIACELNNASSRGRLGFANFIPFLIFSKEQKIYRAIRDHFDISLTTNYGEGDFHPTRKPYEAIYWLVTRFSQPKDFVFDPFLGSGTTLIVAHDLNRVCYGAEINPVYVSGILDRWERHTGVAPALITLPTPRPTGERESGARVLG